ncbi:MAG: hypothetical protein IJL31_00130 [Oscillospiraceae bacterium]|nr:hypothetical protein [Oscillospiraceae bacterium]MBQ6243196.1 hypothetical protein [Bacteroidales bacterium]
MATIIQTPDSISLLRNMKRLVVESASPVVIALLSGESTLFEETYHPDTADRISVDLQDLVAPFLKTVLPSAANTYQQTGATGLFSVTVDGVSAGSFRVVNGGVRKPSVSMTNFLKANWLTWQPQMKRTTWDAPEMLSYFFAVAAVVKAKFYLKSGSSKTITIGSYDANTFWTFNTRMSYLFSLSGEETADLYGYADVWVETALGVQLSYVQRYIHDPKQGDEHYYLCENSLGGIDTFIFRGACTQGTEINHASAETDDAKVDVTTDAARHWQQQTGHLGTRSARWVFELLSSRQAWAIQDGNAEAIIIDADDMSLSDHENLHALSFGYKLATEGHLQNYSRTDGELPEIQVPSPSGDIFFLRARLADFPDASLTGDLLFLAQSPFTEDWKKVSLSALAEALGEIISEGGSSSGLWEGHHFDDYMNQPVRTTDDVQFHKVTTPRIESPSFSEGVLGAGFRMYVNEQGRAVLELDEIDVRRSMKVFELIIQQIKHQGGMVIQSAASMECSSVVELTDGYKCYFDTKDGQIPNEFVAGDQARCQRFNLGTTTAKYYWRLVTAVGDDYIILSKSDCDADSDAPSAGDNIVQLGNRNNLSRQSAKVTTTIDGNSPRDDYYKGINSYDLTGKLITTVGVKDGEVGIWTANGSFSGQVTITGGSGLTNIAEWNDMSWNISSAWSEALAASTAAGTAQGTANQAILDAATAQAAADAAQAAATAIGTKLTNWASDGYISPVEKEALRQQKADVSKEYTEITSRAARYNVGYSAFTTAYTLANAALTKYTATTPELIAVESDFDNIAAYYDARATLLNAVAIAEKNATDTAQQTADNAATAASNAQGSADRALAKTAALEALLDQINDDTVLDLTEKNVIRTQWITINGIEDLGRTGTKGSYVATKALAAIYGNIGASEVLTYNGVELTYNGQHLYYNITGLSALDAAYLALREFLRGVGLNDREHVFTGFDRALFAALLTDYNDAEIKAIDNVNRALSAQMSAFQDAVQRNIDEMQDQLDNTIEYHFGNGVPTTSNAPASSWNTAELKQSHIGDVYYDDNTGYGYRWQVTSGGTYYWKQMPDDAAAKALAAAAKAQDTADGKRRVFLSQPGTSDAYDPGDVWMHATIGSYNDEMLVCRTAKEAGAAFSLSHWGTATKYTDDTVANAAAAAASNAQQTANNASNAAQQAQTTAAAAQTTANAAKTQLDNWAADSKISPVEKEALRQQKADVVSEHTALATEATSYGLSVTAFNAAYTAAITAFNKYTAATPETITIESDYADIAAYYTARATIAQAVAEKAKEAADAAAGAAETAQAAADAAGTAAAEAKEAADAVAAAVAGIDLDTKLDEAEKAAIRVTWTEINGIPSTGSAGKGGTYHAAKVTLAEAGRDGFRTTLTYNGVELTYNGQHLYYNILGESRLDAAYLALREYLNGCQINTPGAFIGFSRDTYAELVRDYQVALNHVLQILSDVAQAAADDAAASAAAAGTAAAAAQTAANNAQAAADAAATTASNAQTAINTWASDGWISPVEKTAMKQQRDDIAAEYNAILDEANKYSIATSTFTSKKTDALAVLDHYIANPTAATQISSSYPLSKIADYYTARTTILQSIATAAKKVATDAQEDADAALDAIDVINAALAKFASDGYISPTEKRTLQQALRDESTNYAGIVAQAQLYTSNAAINVINDTTLTNALSNALTDFIAKYSTNSGNNAFRNVINYYIQDTASPNHSTTWAWSDNVPVSSSYPLSAITNYYDARETLVKKINECGKAYSEKYSKKYTDEEVAAKISAARTAISQEITNSSTGALNSAKDYADGKASAAYNAAVADLQAFGQTIISGGYIKTDLINVGAIASDAGFISNLRVKHLDGADGTFTGTLSAATGSFSGEITATRGTIGGFSIGENTLGTSPSGQPTAGGSYLQEGKLTLFSLFQHTYSGTLYLDTKTIKFDATERSNLLVDISASVADSDGWEANLVRLSVKPSKYAVVCNSGMFAGLRPAIRTAYSGSALEDNDNVIIISNGTLYLPSSPKKGQMYIIFHTSSSYLLISGNGKTICNMSHSGGNGSTMESSSVETILLHYDGSYWYLAYIYR